MAKSLRPFYTILAIVGIVAAVTYGPRLFQGEEVVAWGSDYHAALAQAGKVNKPVLLYFTASWCGPCQQMKHTTFANREVAGEIAQRFVPVRLDVDENRNLAAQYQVQSIPDFKVLSADGRVLRDQSGFMDVPEFKAWISQPANP